MSVPLRTRCTIGAFLWSRGFAMIPDHLCVCWGGPRKEDGRGIKSGRNAARWVWQQFYGVRLTSEQYVCHTCDNSLCVRIEHLYVGDAQTNMTDMKERGRGRKRSTSAACRNGHPFTEESAYVNPTNGHRSCRVCANAAAKRYYVKKSARFR